MRRDDGRTRELSRPELHGRIWTLLVLAAVLGCGTPDGPPASEPPVRMHDHSPHHGGVVGMAGDLHAEVVAVPDGLVRVYLSDLRRRPLAPATASGSVVLTLPERKLTLPLAPGADALEARATVLPVGDLAVHVALVREQRPLELSLVVPVGIAAGLTGLPRTCTAPLGPAPRGRVLPRCTVEFPRMVRALVTTPDAGLVLIGVFDHGVSLWRLPAAEAIGALDAAPDLGDHPGHVHPVDALAVRADGREAAVAVRRQILRYAIPEGRLVAALPRDPHVIRALAYTPDGSHLLASTLFDGTVEIMDAREGSERGRLRIDRALAAVAFGSDGRLVAMASERGPVSLFAPPVAAVRHLLPATSPVRAVSLAGEHVVTGADDGVLTVWSLGKARPVVRTPAGPAVLTLAVHPANGVLASGCLDGAVRVYDLPGAKLVRTLGWHTAPVQSLAWVGGLLASGDSRGGLAFWSMEDLVAAGAR
jgi:hypothetical protein